MYKPSLRPVAFIFVSLLDIACLPPVTHADEFLTQVSAAFIGTINPAGTVSISNLTGPGGAFVFPLAINDSGQIVEQTSQFASFIATGSSFAPISVPGANFTEASGINNSDQVVGTSSAGPFIYDSGNFTGFTVLGTTVGVGASGISNTGQVVGSYEAGANQNDAHPAGFVYSNGTVQTYDLNGQSGTVFRGINSSGEIIGSTFPGGLEQAFLYDANSGVETPFIVPGAASESALGINDNGQIVGHFSDSSTTHGFLYIDGEFITIDYPSGPNTVNVNTILTGINDEGQFVGYVTYDRVPEPSTLFLLGIGLFGLAMLSVKKTVG